MNLPAPFLAQIRDLLGSETEMFLNALEQPAPVSIRLNPGKTGEKPLPVGVSTGQSVLWCDNGFYLETRPAFTFDPLLHAGCYYVQEASSMFVAQAVKRALERIGESPLVALDLCAAPGGKSTLLSSVLPEGSLLVANELARTRANILAENLIKWGSPDVVVTQSDSSAFASLEATFDLILTDVPCSGEGMFRKDPDSIAEWSPENVRMCALRQRDIVRNIWPTLKPGGFLIYSTCTYNLHEDEENVQWICEELGGNTIEIQTSAEWGISGAKSKFGHLQVYRFFPHRTRGEGFFLTLIQKREEDDLQGSVGWRATKQKGKSITKSKIPVVPEELRSWLKDATRFHFKMDRLGRPIAFPAQHLSLLEKLEENLRTVHAGVLLGEIKGKDWLPDVSLALSTSLQTSKARKVELDLKSAVTYLRKESLILPEEAPQGWVLVCYNGYPLGWMKNLGNRANNAYPAEWRIRSENPW